MAIKTTYEQLQEVQEAITAVTTGAQSYTTKDGLEVTRANLPALTRREQILLARLNKNHRRRSRPDFNVVA